MNTFHRIHSHRAHQETSRLNRLKPHNPALEEQKHSLELRPTHLHCLKKEIRRNRRRTHLLKAWIKLLESQYAHLSIKAILETILETIREVPWGNQEIRLANRIISALALYANCTTPITWKDQIHPCLSLSNKCPRAVSVKSGIPAISLTLQNIDKIDI